MNGLDVMISLSDDQAQWRYEPRILRAIGWWKLIQDVPSYWTSTLKAE